MGCPTSTYCCDGQVSTYFWWHSAKRAIAVSVMWVNLYLEWGNEKHIGNISFIKRYFEPRTYFPEYSVWISSGRVAVGPTAFSARQNTACRLSLNPWYKQHTITGTIIITLISHNFNNIQYSKYGWGLKITWIIFLFTHLPRPSNKVIKHHVIQPSFPSSCLLHIGTCGSICLAISD